MALFCWVSGAPSYLSGGMGFRRDFLLSSDISESEELSVSESELSGSDGEMSDSLRGSILESVVSEL
ncbi:uncharacterized protein LACBIDRAFT_313002 [Laccaria bicolor S238N-H82]|uniref:Predicted protein n=1 Tax=Laccaria bicolor (strain S238N-H82 / ATCC MYA-4686) TaxID=486041 RepID=B0DXB6_LACBS|nr:uncharacterized protein LACBIDRAFT_313002 [Laccaria bicolor S238N-H82]EDR00763.1 predicted protein [Laccaria bicolor S238N-H82]|eukprot:XP_001888555.1 predicted protein [Laccaria bicolor S238N-H82]